VIPLPSWGADRGSELLATRLDELPLDPAASTRPRLHAWYALVDAGLAPCHPRPRPALRALATRWLAGELDAAVDVPITVVCAVLDLDAAALAPVARARSAAGS